MADDTMTIKAWDGNVALPGTDKDIVAMFHKDTKINFLKSREIGAPVYDQVDFLKVIHPGEPLNIYDQPVREQDKYRFRDLWERYQKGASQDASGTPLSVLFPHQPEIVKTMAAIHVTTVQQLAAMSDTAKQNIMFGMNLSEMAKQYLSVASNGAEFHKMAGTIEDLRQQLRETNERLELVKNQPAPQADNGLAATVAALAAQVSQMSQRKKPGRKPKIQEQET